MVCSYHQLRLYMDFLLWRCGSLSLTLLIEWTPHSNLERKTIGPPDTSTLPVLTATSFLSDVHESLRCFCKATAGGKSLPGRIPLIARHRAFWGCWSVYWTWAEIQPIGLFDVVTTLNVDWQLLHFFPGYLSYNDTRRAPTNERWQVSRLAFHTRIQSSSHPWATQNLGSETIKEQKVLSTWCTLSQNTEDVANARADATRDDLQLPRCKFRCTNQHTHDQDMHLVWVVSLRPGIFAQLITDFLLFFGAEHLWPKQQNRIYEIDEAAWLSLEQYW